MSYSLPEVVKKAETVLVEIERAVEGMARKHRYVFGSDLRQQALQVAKQAHRAWRDRGERLQRTEVLVADIDDLRITLQLGSRIKAFHSFGQFEAIAREAHSLGAQAGGWLKQQRKHPSQGQSAPRGYAGQRAKTLSSQTASSGANA